MGEKAFGKLTDSVSNDDFCFFPQKSSSFGGDGNLSDVNLRLDKITTEIDNFGRAKKQEVVVYRRDVRLKDFKEGKLNFDNNPIYKWNSFKVLQKFEMKNTLSENRIYLDKAYLTDDEVSFVIKEFADNPSVWKIDKIRGNDYLIHTSAQIRDNEIGTLVHSKKEFSEAEWAEVKEVLELNKQYGIVSRKLKGEVSPEYGETREGLAIWEKELEKRLLINSIRKNADKWEIRKEIVVLDFNEGEVLARKTVKINRDEDYDLTGGLINKSNEFYSLDYFDDKEQAEINLIFQPVRQEVVDDIKQGGFTFWNMTNGEKWYIRNSVDLSSGRVVFDPKNMYKVNDLTEAEQKIIGCKSEKVSQNSLIVSDTPKNDNKLGTGGIVATVVGVSALAIAGTVAIRKKLKKKKG